MLKQIEQFLKKYPLIKDLCWFKSGDWGSGVLRKEVYYLGSLPASFKEYTGLDFGNRFSIHIEPTQYDCHENIKDMLLAIKFKIIKDPFYLENLSKKLLKIIKENEEYAKSINSMDLSNLDNFALKRLFNKFLKNYCKLIPYSVIFMHSGEYEITKNVFRHIFPNEQDIDALYNKVMLPPKGYESHVQKSQKLLLKIKTRIKSHRHPDNLISKYQKELGWLHTRHWQGEIPSSKEIIKLAIASKESKKATENVPLFNLSKSRKQILKSLRYQTFLKTYRKEMMSKIDFLVRPLHLEIANRMKLKYKDYLYCTLDEITSFFKSGKVISHTEICNRKKGYASLVVDGKIYLETDIQNNSENSKSEYFVKGSSAYNGKIEGFVKVVSDSSQQKKVKKGDILVADMTNPDLIHAITTAKGMITNRGGILCHAALISRELKKPCIIGTKNATEVFSDGDYIILDANKGVAYKKMKK